MFIIRLTSTHGQDYFLNQDMWASDYQNATQYKDWDTAFEMGCHFLRPVLGKVREWKVVEV